MIHIQTGTTSNKISTPADMPLPHLSLDQNIVIDETMSILKMNYLVYG
jgi:hypothetical protein